MHEPVVLIDFTEGVEQARWTFAGEGVPKVIAFDFDPEGVGDNRESYIDAAEAIAEELEAHHLIDCNATHGTHGHWNPDRRDYDPCPDEAGSEACAGRYATPAPCLLLDAEAYRERAAEWRQDEEDNARQAAAERAEAEERERRRDEIAERAGVARDEIDDLFR